MPTHNWSSWKDTFFRASDISIPVVYTGFVTPGPPPGARAQIRQALKLTDDTKLIMASAGGGRVGFELLSATLRAFRLLGTANEHRLLVFTGPFMEPDQFSQLENLAGHGASVTRFTDEFPSYLAAADLSVSMAGYNTTMNVLACRTPALVWPFGQNREQRLRAETLQSLGGPGILEDVDLEPERLAERLLEALRLDRPERLAIKLDGAKTSAAWLEDWMGRP